MCRANHCGWYQILDPVIAMLAGTRVSRTTKALAFDVLFFIPECLPDLADLTDEELREALQTTILRMLRVPF